MCALAHVFSTQPDILQQLLFSRALESAKGNSQEEMVTHSSILACRILWSGEPGGCNPWGHKELDMTEHACKGLLGSILGMHTALPQMDL